MDIGASRADSLISLSSLEIYFSIFQLYPMKMFTTTITVLYPIAYSCFTNVPFFKTTMNPFFLRGGVSVLPGRALMPCAMTHSGR